MKYRKTLAELGRALVAGFCIAAISFPQSARACMGTRPFPCLINPTSCLKSMVLTKAMPIGAVPIPIGGPALVNVPLNLFLTCPVTNNCGSVCVNGGAPVKAELTVNLYGPYASAAACPPAAPLPPSAAAASITTVGGTMTLPACTSAGANNPYNVVVNVPAGTPPGVYCVIGTAVVTFSDNTVLTQSGDTIVCLVEAAPGQPGVPRLGLQLLSPNFPRVAPGDQAVAIYQVTNNDPSNSVQVAAFATSKQGALRPQGGNEAQGVFAISSPFGDDFPILFNPGTNCIPLPDHPYTQPEACQQLPLLAPGKFFNVTVGIRSYGQCADGSCSETTLRVEGMFSDGSPAMACGGMSLLVDTSMQSQNCGRQVNDCNQNGIPDSLDISSRRSQDQNFNAMPDECEQIITIPLAASVAPNNPVIGAPIRVQIAFNEGVNFPMMNVWADGTPLTRTMSFGFPIWVGTIAADTRPGPQTVFFLGKDNFGGLSSYIALYNTHSASNIPFGGLNNMPLGNATLNPTSNSLVVANIGSSGQDGVSVNLGTTAGFALTLQPLGLNSPGAMLNIGAAGAIGGLRDAFLGQATLVRTDSVVQVLGDFRAIGDPNVLVEMWSNNTFVGGTTLPAGDLGRLVGNANIFVSRVGKFGSIVPFPCIPVDFLQPVVFVANNNQTFQGNQLRLLSAGGPDRIRTLSRFFLQGANLGGSMTILQESLSDPFGLNIARAGTSVVVSWSNAPNFVLETKAALGPQPLPWSEVFNAVSPYTVPQLGSQQYFRLKRDDGANPPSPPGIVPPPVTSRTPLQSDPGKLPPGATGQLPSMDGDPLFVSLPITQRSNVSSSEVFSTIILPIAQAMGINQSNALALPQQGFAQPRASFDGLIPALKYEYDNNPGIAGPQTSNMLAVFMRTIPPNATIDNALLTGEGMTFSQYVAGIERQEIQYPFQQTHNNVPIEHTMLIASRWEGQGIHSVWGTLLNRYIIGNSIVLTGSNNIVQAAVQDLGRQAGLCPPFSSGGGNPELMLLPYGSDTLGNYILRYAYRMILLGNTLSGPNEFMVWLDAETGRILKLETLGWDVTATGATYNRDPGIGTTTSSFQVNAADGGQYVLQIAGVMNRMDYQGDGYNASDVGISSTLNGSSATFANFNQAPINNAAQALASSGSNKGFQQVNLFGVLHRDYIAASSLGVYPPFPFDFGNVANALPWTPQVDKPGYNNARGDLMWFGAGMGYFDPACPNFSTGTRSGNNYMNFAHDNSIIGHELGHPLTRRLTNLRPANWCGGGVCAIPVGWVNLHDLADFWGDHFESCNCAGGWMAKNQGGVNAALNCVANHDEGGSLPRLHQVTVPFNPGSPGDHFPEHRSLSTHAYGDGQIGTAALWQVRLGMRSKCRPSGIPQFIVRFTRALRRTGFYPAPACDGHLFQNCSDTVIYRYLYDLLTQMTDEWATSGSPGGAPAFAHNGPHSTSKVLAGFAKTGIFLIAPDRLDGNPAPPDNGGDAVIDIDDNAPGDDYTINGCNHPEVDFLRLGGPAPIFHVWTGPRYRLSGAGGAATFNNPAPCNTQFQVEVSTSSTFAPASTINSGFIVVDTNPTTPASPEGYGTWTPTAGQWATLQAGGAGTRIYYRARTRDAANANERLSTLPGNGTWTVPPPYAVITTTGMSDY